MSGRGAVIAMGPVEDTIAWSLYSAGRSYREIGELFGRSDKSIACAVERAAELDGEYPLLDLINNRQVQKALSAEDKALLSNVASFLKWVRLGTESGYLAVLVRLLELKE